MIKELTNKDVFFSKCIVFTLFFVVLFLFLFNNYNTNLGVLTYFYDDAYIHLAIAENFATYGIPSSDGVSPSNGSSSPLWLMFLTSMFLLFDKETVTMIPMFVNVLTAIGLIYFFIKTIVDLKVVRSIDGIVIASVIYIALIPLFPLIQVGMEHGLQSLTAISFLYYSNKWIENRDNKDYKKVLFLAALLPLIRYEMSLLVFIVAVYGYVKSGKIEGSIFIKNKDISSSILILVIGATPVILYGVYMMSLGLSFFPDSVVAKGSSGDNMFGVIMDMRPESQAKKIPIIMMMILPYVSHIVIMMASLRLKVYKIATPKTMLWSISAGTMALFQMYFSMPTPVRYDAYLMAIGVIPLIEVTILIFKKKVCTSYIPGSIMLSSIFGILFVSKLALGHVMMIFGVNNIHDQQGQNALFIRDFAKAKKIVINDLGMVSYYTKTEIFDLEGLGTHEVALMKKNGTFSPEAISKKIETNGTDWVMIYDDWYKDGKYIPDSCIRIGKAVLRVNLICGSDEVAFYYCGKNTKKAKQNFLNFSKTFKKNTEDRAYAIVE